MVNIRRLNQMADRLSGQSPGQSSSPSSGETTARHWQLMFPTAEHNGETIFTPIITANQVLSHSRMGSDVNFMSSNLCWLDYPNKVCHTLNTRYLLEHHNPDQCKDPVSMELIRRLHPDHTPPAVLDLIKLGGSYAERTEDWDRAVDALLDHIHSITHDIADDLKASPFC